MANKTVNYDTENKIDESEWDVGVNKKINPGKRACLIQVF